MVRTVSLALAVVVLTAGAKSVLAQEAGGRLTIQEAVNLALKQNPSIKESKERMTSAKEQIGISRAGLLPQINFMGSYYYGTAFGRGLGSLSSGGSGALSGGGSSPLSGSIPAGVSASPLAVDLSPLNYYSYRFTLNQLIFDFGKTPGQVATSKAAFKEAAESLANTRQQVARDTRTAYYGYLAAMKAQKVAEENVRQNQELLKQAQGFYQVGLRARIDVTKAEANLMNAEASLIKAKNLVAVSRVTLMTVLGLKDWPYTSVEDILEVEHKVQSLEELKAQALNQRPEILGNRYQQEGNQASIRVARAGYFPTLSSTASFGWQGYNPPLNDSWWLGAMVNFPLFEGLATTHTLRQAKANLRTTQANAEVLTLNVTKEVEQSYLDVQSAKEVIRANRKAREAAAENLRLAWGRYKAGVGDIIEVTDAQVQFAQADLNYVRALYDYKVAEANLDKAIGRPF
ncbi:MAG: TolC family protein [Desulfobaccales bacterium]